MQVVLHRKKKPQTFCTTEMELTEVLLRAPIKAESLMLVSFLSLRPGCGTHGYVQQKEDTHKFEIECL